MAFIVLEGLDGAGKSTQTENIISLAGRLGRECDFMHFPRFDSPVYGELIARFLRGEFGAASEVDPYIVALLYAGDRKNAAEKIRNSIAEGRHVIVDRYVVSNIAYQCAKVADAGERERLREWIIGLEYGENAIPRPDMTIFLNVPFSFTEKKLTAAREGDDRSYLKGGEDIHESSLKLQMEVRRVYLDEAKRDKGMAVVECADGEGNMLPPEKISAKIEALIKDIL